MITHLVNRPCPAIPTPVTGHRNLARLTTRIRYLPPKNNTTPTNNTSNPVVIQYQKFSSLAFFCWA